VSNSPLDRALIAASVAALQKHHNEKRSAPKNGKAAPTPLFDDVTPITLVIACRQAPPASLEPHPMYGDVAATNIIPRMSFIFLSF
jgi:hypothetical protein